MKSLAGVAAKTRPLGHHLFAVARYRLQRRAARLGHAAERLFDDVHQAAALVAGCGVGAAVGLPQRQVVVIPAHLADESQRHVSRGRARR